LRFRCFTTENVPKPEKPAENVEKKLEAKPIITPPVPPPVERKMETKPPTTNTTFVPPKEKSYRELKRILGLKPPRLMKVWYMVGAVGLVAAVLYYLNGADEQERKVHGIVRMLGTPDLETRKLALQALDQCLFEERKLLSTTAEFPQPKSYLVQQGTVEALYNAFEDGDDDVKAGAAIWLLRLTPEEGARKRIAKRGLEPILKEIKNAEGSSNVWLTCSALLMELSKYKDSIGLLSTAQVGEALNNLYTSPDPIAKLAPQICTM